MTSHFRPTPQDQDEWHLFSELLAKMLPEDRGHLADEDEACFYRIMRVIFTGVSHGEASDDECSEVELILWHKEMTENHVLVQYLLLYSLIAIRREAEQSSRRDRREYRTDDDATGRW